MKGGRLALPLTVGRGLAPAAKSAKSHGGGEPPPYGKHITHT